MEPRPIGPGLGGFPGISLLGSSVNSGNGSSLTKYKIFRKIVHMTHVTILQLMPLSCREKRRKGEEQEYALSGNYRRL